MTVIRQLTDNGHLLSLFDLEAENISDGQWLYIIRHYFYGNRLGNYYLGYTLLFLANIENSK